MHKIILDNESISRFSVNRKPDEFDIVEQKKIHSVEYDIEMYSLKFGISNQTNSYITYVKPYGLYNVKKLLGAVRFLNVFGDEWNIQGARINISIKEFDRTVNFIKVDDYVELISQEYTRDMNALTHDDFYFLQNPRNIITF